MRVFGLVGSFFSSISSFCDQTPDPSECSSPIDVIMPAAEPNPDYDSRPSSEPEPEPDISGMTPDEVSAALRAAIGDKHTLKSILATLPGVDPDEPRFAIFYAGHGPPL
jgi:hypothetical protein